MVGSHAYLLIRIKGYADVTMLDVVVVAQEAHRLYDFGDTCLIVGSKQCGTVGDDEVFSYMGI